MLPVGRGEELPRFLPHVGRGFPRHETGSGAAGWSFLHSEPLLYHVFPVSLFWLLHILWWIYVQGRNYWLSVWFLCPMVHCIYMGVIFGFSFCVLLYIVRGCNFWLWFLCLVHGCNFRSLYCLFVQCTLVVYV